MNRKRSLNIFAYSMSIPAFILFIFFMIIPTIYIFVMSLFSWMGLNDPMKFVGLSNFEILFKDPNFYHAFKNTVFLIVFVTIVTLTIAVLMASILVRENVKGKSLFRVIFYIPNILSIVVIAAIFGAIYHPTNGMLNSVISFFKGEPHTWDWIGQHSTVLYALAVALIWQAIGYYMVMYMASMASIPEHLYESSALDGASGRQQFFNITLPLVWNTIRTTLTFFVISTINLSFLLVKAISYTRTDGASEVFLSFLYKQADNNTYGYAMAAGVIIFIFSFALSALINKITKREVYQY